MKKITYEPLTSPRHAHEKSIDIWTVLANMPDGTHKVDVIEEGYHCNCPVCHLVNLQGLRCFEGDCPLSDEFTHCENTGEPFNVWKRDRTAANAQTLLNQLHDTYKQRYGEEYVTDIMEQLKGEE